jgi:hypothetical protein
MRKNNNGLPDNNNSDNPGIDLPKVLQTSRTNNNQYLLYDWICHCKDRTNMIQLK